MRCAKNIKIVFLSNLLFRCWWECSKWKKSFAQLPLHHIWRRRTGSGAARGLGPHGVWGRPSLQPAINPERDRRNASTVFSSRVYGNPA